LKDGFDFVVAIIALAEDAQAPIYLGECWDSEMCLRQIV
jgi:hypothetical protein